MKKYIVIIFIIGFIFPTMSILAKGGFDYIAVRGPGITGELDITNPALTQDFFAFADFVQGEVSPPADPGQGYQVVRMYVENSKGIPFDELHYYPYTGYVFYDGIVNGSSEYDGKWYTANPPVNEPFRAALAERARFTWIPLSVLVVLLGVFFIAYNRKSKKE